MRTYVLTHLSDSALLHGLNALVARERRLYLPAGFTSMHAYCVGKLRLSEDSASKRIQVARVARDLPALFDALANGRVHLTGLGLLAPHLTAGNVDDLLSEATHKTKSEIERLLARRFPGNECMELVDVFHAPRTAAPESDGVAIHEPSLSAEIGEHAPAHVVALAPPTRVKPLAADRHSLTLTLDNEGYELLRYAQALLSHQIPSGDLAQVIVHSLRELVSRAEKQKFAKTTRPRAGSQRPSQNPRYIPARVKRAVYERDQGRCTFIGEEGHRCGTRARLEFDHILPVARGGRATVENLRLRCRGHNGLEAERVFGASFMKSKRDAARQARGTEVGARDSVEAHAAAERARDLTTCLRELRFGAAEARRAVEFCATLPDASLEGQVRAALGFLCARPRAPVSS